MIYLKNNHGGNIAVLKDSDTKEAKNLLESGQWVRVNSRKDYTEYVEKKSSPKKKSKAKKVSKSGK